MPKSLLALVAASLGLSLATFATGCAATTDADESIADSEDALTRAQCRGARGDTDAACRINGTVEKVVIAEFDPFVVGEACLTLVRVGNKRYGLVRNPDACEPTRRFEGTEIVVSFSKGAIDPVSSARRKVFKDYDADVTYYDFSSDVRANEDSALAVFDAKDTKGKLAFLYDVHQQDWATPKPETTLAPVQIVDAFDGALKDKALGAYYDVRDFGFENGADHRPEVFAVQRDGITYLYQISSSGNSYGDWASVHVFDRQWNEIHVFSYTE